MASSQFTPIGCCPKCGAQWIAGQPRCWLCHGNARAPSRGADDAAAGIASLQPMTFGPAVPTEHFQFGISSLLLLTTFVAILCSIFKMNPGVGFLVAVLAVPALLRTIVVAMRRSESGNPMSSGGKTGVFLLTLLVAFIVPVAVIGAFIIAALATCVAIGGPGLGGLGNPGLALVCGGIAGLGAAVLCAWVIWKLLRYNRGR